MQDPPHGSSCKSTEMKNFSADDAKAMAPATARQSKGEGPFLPSTTNLNNMIRIKRRAASLEWQRGVESHSRGSMSEPTKNTNREDKEPWFYTFEEFAEAPFDFDETSITPPDFDQTSITAADYVKETLTLLKGLGTRRGAQMLTEDDVDRVLRWEEERLKETSLTTMHKPEERWRKICERTYASKWVMSNPNIDEVTVLEKVNGWSGHMPVFDVDNHAFASLH